MYHDFYWLGRPYMMKFVGLNALGALSAAATAGSKIPAVTIKAEKAKLTKEDFGDLRIARGRDRPVEVP